MGRLPKLFMLVVWRKHQLTALLAGGDGNLYFLCLNVYGLTLLLFLLQMSLFVILNECEMSQMYKTFVA
jgi:hypothetical protein